MSDEIIIDDKGQAVGLNEGLSVQDNDAHAYRLVGLIFGYARVQFQANEVGIYSEAEANGALVRLFPPATENPLSGADLDAFELQGGTCTLRGHYGPDKKGDYQLSLRATTPLRLKPVLGKGERYFCDEDCIIRKVTLWYRKDGKTYEENVLKPKDSRISVRLNPSQVVTRSR